MRLGYGLTLCVLLLLCGCKEQLLQNLTETQANNIVSSLSQAGIYSQKRKDSDGTWALLVGESDLSNALKLVDERRLLRATSAAGGPAKGSLLSSREEQRFSMERALSRELEGTLGSIDGVVEARVHLNMPPVDPLLGRSITGAKGSASVLLVTAQDSGLDRRQVSQLVAGAAGIAVEHVAVVVTVIGADEVRNGLPGSDKSQAIAQGADLQIERPSMYDWLTALLTRNVQIGALILLAVIWLSWFALKRRRWLRLRCVDAVGSK
ncbi:MAG: hypothetical protein DCC49_10990 [Acidobacteria bacterium]|nr:MAG: hypothetical protein DCC49_10990 [Acidobacteriota bacterium]